MQIVFERQILESLRIKNPDLLNAFVCLGLAAGADGVAVMTAPGPLAHIKHKRRAGMISALVAAGFLRRAPGGYLVHGVGSEGTDRGQTEDTESTAAREASHCNTFQDNSEWTEDRQAGDSEGLADAFIDISDLDEPQPTAPIMSLGLRRSAVSTAATPPDDEALEARAREMALADWDVTDARTFETCEGDFAQFWTYRKRHFLAQARQELGPAES